VAAGQARAGFPDEALGTLADGDPGRFAAGEIALALALAGRPDKALATVQRLDEPEAKVRALVRLAGATCSAHWLRHAAALVADIKDETDQSGLWTSIAIAHAQLWQRDSALRTAGLVATGYRRAEALAGIAAAIHDGRLLEDARNHALDVRDHRHRDETWAALARAEIALGALQEAYQTLKAKLPGAPSRALAAAVGELAAVYWLDGDPSGARKLIDELLGGSWTIGEARTVLARRLIAADRLDDARQISFLVDEITFDNLSAEIALKQAGNGAFSRALMTADSIQHPGRRAPTLAEISTLLPE
jgi:tetratricopeptide (TPR) repeat protein